MVALSVSTRLLSAVLEAEVVASAVDAEAAVAATTLVEVDPTAVVDTVVVVRVATPVVVVDMAAVVKAATVVVNRVSHNSSSTDPLEGRASFSLKLTY